MKLVVLDAATVGEDLDLSLFDEFGEVTRYADTAPDEVAARVRDAEVLIINKMRLNESNLAGAAALKLICIAATGYDNIDVAYCRRRGIGVCNVPGYSTDSVAQVTLAMALSLTTHLKEYRRYADSGEYSVSGVANRLVPVYHEISAMTWGVVGGGNIAARVAGVAEALGCRVLMHRRQAETRYTAASLDEICRESDILSLHVPLTDSTRGMIDRAHLAMMKPTAILINTARGAVTDEAAVAEAIEAGRLGGFGTDVYSEEPFGDTHPVYRLRGRDNVCLTPHMAWGARQARERCMAVIADNIRSFAAGGRNNRVD